MKIARTLRKVFLLFSRDIAIASSYRTLFVLQFVETLFGVAPLFYLSRFMERGGLKGLLPQGEDYFAFALVGIAFFDYLGVSLNAFDQSLIEARQNGTLEYLLVTQTSLPVILAGSAVYPFLMLSLRTMIYFAWGLILFGFPAGQANWAGAILVLSASVLAFVGLGVFSASYILIFKRGNPVKWFFVAIAGLVSGVMYPVSVLPKLLQWGAYLIPVTYSLEGMRAALLSHASMAMLWPSIRALLLFAVVLLPTSFVVFSWALHRTKVTGTLVHF